MQEWGGGGEWVEYRIWLDLCQEWTPNNMCYDESGLCEHTKLY